MANAAFVESRARISPHTAACWIDVNGTLAMFDGPGSPCTQTFGLGILSSIDETDLDTLEEFFLTKNAPVLHEVSPMAEGHLPLLADRGYRAIELTSVMMADLSEGHDRKRVPSAGLQTRVVPAEEAELWAATSAAGWLAEHPEMGEFMLDFGRVSVGCEGGYPFIAELDGEPIATAMLFVNGEVAFLAGASTIPAGRNKGPQSALLAARFDFARQAGCQLAAMGASPGSQSQRNAEKNGFQIAYTRTKWQLSDK